MPASQPRPDRIPEPQPENARQAVAMTRDDHQWRRAVLDINSTDGIKRNIDALWAAINRLAEFVDGDSTDTPAKASTDPKPYQAPKTQADYDRERQATQPVSPSPVHAA